MPSLDRIFERLSLIHSHLTEIYHRIASKHGRPTAIAIFALLFSILLVSGTAFAYVPIQDADGDGAPNYQEWMPNHHTNWQLRDTDGDGLTDGIELSSRQYNATNIDTDSDRLNDSQEFYFNSNASLADTDGDKLSDFEEYRLKTNPNLNDTDGDGLSDAQEVNWLSSPLITDTDSDSLSDQLEFQLNSNPTATDTDGDFLSDIREFKLNTSLTKIDTDNDNLTDTSEVVELPSDPLEPDTDFDGLDDWIEVNGLTRVNVSDTDADGLKDGPEIDNGTSPVQADTDNDTLRDGREVKHLSTNPLSNDTDEDMLLDGTEVREYKTDPTNNDTDGDRLSDGHEVLDYSTNPLKQDSDNDSVSDTREVLDLQTSPTNPDTDGDSLLDGTELRENAFDPITPDPLHEDRSKLRLSKQGSHQMSDLIDTLVALSHAATTGDVNGEKMRQFGNSVCNSLDLSTTGTKTTAVDNFKQAGLYQVLDLLSTELGYKVSSSAVRGRLRQIIALGSQFSGVLAISNDLIRLQNQACNLVDEIPENDAAAEIGVVVSTSILALDVYLLVQTGGTLGSSAVYKSAFGITRKTGLARLAKYCGWKCVGGIQRLVHWSLRTALDTGKDKLIASIIRIGYSSETALSLYALLKDLDASQIRAIIGAVDSLLPDEIMSALREVAPELIDSTIGDFLAVSHPGPRVDGQIAAIQE